MTQVKRFGSYRVTREEVIEFARKFDPQPFHLSDEAAARTHFGRLAASGWHTTAMTMAMIVDTMIADAAQGEAEEGLGAIGVDELRWLRPVHPGNILRCEQEILEVRPSRSKPSVLIQSSIIKVYNENDELVMSFKPIEMKRAR